MEQSQVGEQGTQRTYLNSVSKIDSHYQQVEQAAHQPLHSSDIAQRVKSYLKVFNLRSSDARDVKNSTESKRVHDAGQKGGSRHDNSQSRINVNVRKSLTPFQNRKLQQKSIHNLKREKRDFKKNQQMKQFRHPFIFIESVKATEKDKTKSKSKSNTKEEKALQDNISRIRSGIQFMRGGKRLSRQEREQLRISKMRSSTKISDMMVLSTFEEKQRQSHQEYTRQTTHSSFSIEDESANKATFKRKNSVTLNQSALGGRVSKASEKVLVKEERKARNQLRPYLFSRSINSMMKIKSLSKNKLFRPLTEEVEKDEYQKTRHGHRLKKGRSLSEKKSKVRGQLERSTRDMLKLQFKMLQFCGWEANHQSSQRVLFS